MIVSALALAMLLVIWFETDAFIEYFGWLGRVFPNSLLKKYVDAKADMLNSNFVSFLAECSNSFLTKLITCPICISVWCGLVVYFLPTNITYLLAISFLGLSFYKVFRKLK